MMKRTIIAVIAALTISSSSFGWSFTGHDAVAYIAECNLKPEVKALMDKYLDGKSIVYYSTYIDMMRFIEEYQTTHLKYAHTARYHADFTPVLDEKDGPNAMVQIPRTIERLSGGKFKEMEKEEVALCIKYLVHAVGDIHCPGHIRIEGLKYGDGTKVVFYGEKTSYHGVWDNALITFIHPWNYMEYNHQLGNLTAEQKAEVTAGTVVDWGREMAEYVRPVYDWIFPNCELDKPFIYKAYPIADRCIQLAGYRLAKVLNDCFSCDE